MNKNAAAHLSLFAVNLFYGLNFLIAKGLMPDLVGPSGFIVLRVLCTTVLFWLLWAAVYRERITDKKDLWLMAKCAVFGVCANQILFFNGLNHTSPVNASIIMVSTPILVLVMAALIQGERITGIKALGVALGAGGALALVLMRGGSDNGSTWYGDLMVLLNGLSYAVYLVMVKPLMVKYKPLTVISYVFLFGLPMVIPFGWNQFTAIQWSSMTASNVYAIVFVVFCVTFLAYLLNIFALKYVTASVTGVYIYMQPFVATLLMAAMAKWFGGPPADITWGKLACGIAIFTGVALVSRKSLRAEVKN
ncbi:MAG TPA: DMT family transporter [Luteibaculaceae bacterium]|nr:DMT family transporter [Luteibaculaceae bacterium]